MVKFGRDSQGHLIQLLAQAGPPRNDDHVQMAFEFLQGGRLYHFPGQAVLGLSYSPSKKVFHDVQAGPSVFVLIASGPVTEHYLKEPGCVTFTPCLQVIMYIDQTLPSPDTL